MIGEFLSWYFNSLAEFWGTAMRIGLPQILLVILLICWLRRRCCGKSSGKSFCWMWTCGSDDGGGSDKPSQCGCACGCCGRNACEAQAGDEEDGDA